MLICSESLKPDLMESRPVKPSLQPHDLLSTYHVPGTVSGTGDRMGEREGCDKEDKAGWGGGHYRVHGWVRPP